MYVICGRRAVNTWRTAQKKGGGGEEGRKVQVAPKRRMVGPGGKEQSGMKENEGRGKGTKTNNNNNNND